MHHRDARVIILSDTMDCKILNTIGEFIDLCPDHSLLQQILPHLVPMQVGERAAAGVPSLQTQRWMSIYFNMRDEMESQHVGKFIRMVITHERKRQRRKNERIELFGKPALSLPFSRIDRATVPKGFGCYELRGGSRDRENPSTLENTVSMDLCRIGADNYPVSHTPKTVSRLLNGKLSFSGECLTLPDVLRGSRTGASTR
jgi:hypothetical protein